MKVSLLTGGSDKTYAFGLALSLLEKNIELDFIGSNELMDENILKNNNINFLNLRGDQNPKSSMYKKTIRILKYYYRLIIYAMQTESRLFHILWLNKFTFIDRTMLNIFYKLLGKKLVFTAHNVDQKERDGGNTLSNRISLKILYNIVDHIFVHTEKSKNHLVNVFNINIKKITVIPFGINVIVPSTNLNKNDAKKILGIGPEEDIILFFGRIEKYKGIDLLLSAFDKVRKNNHNIKLVIAGHTQTSESANFWNNIKNMIDENGLSEYVILKIEYIPDDEIEVYFKSADVCILPYRYIFQTGILFIAYRFGLPVIATDVGSFREDIVEGKTGFICNPNDPEDLKNKILMFYKSDMYIKKSLSESYIKEYAFKKYSWNLVGEETCKVYNKLLDA